MKKPSIKEPLFKFVQNRVCLNQGFYRLGHGETDIAVYRAT